MSRETAGGDGAALKPYASRRQLSLLQSRPLYQQPLYAHWGVQIAPVAMKMPSTQGGM